MSDIDCPSCKKDDMVQKITAIVGGETTNTSGYSRTSGSSDLSGSQNIYDSQGRKIGEGRLSGTSSSGSSTSINATQKSNLATMLQAPREPSKPTKPVYPSEKRKEIIAGSAGGEFAILALLIFIGVCIFLWVNATKKPNIIEAGVGGFLVLIAVMTPFLIPMTILEWMAKNVDSVYRYYERTNAKDERIIQLDMTYKADMEQYEQKNNEYVKTLLPRYQRQIERWNKAFYCRRCDVTYLPGETRSVSPSQIDLIL